ncbi:MAG: ribosome maturation factor RimP [Pseudomonadota bacterium]
MGNIGDTVLGEIEGTIQGIVEHEGMELVDIEYQREPHGWVLRVYIDKQGGVTVDDCSFISSQLGDTLDVKDMFLYPYKLEVSSPGFNRPLKKEKDFKKFIGETVSITTHAPIDNRKNFKGKLTDYREGSIFIDVDGKIFSVSHDAVRKAHLEYGFEQKGAQKGRKK